MQYLFAATFNPVRPELVEGVNGAQSWLIKVLAVSAKFFIYYDHGSTGSPRTE
jgi:hypothetical protein